MNGRSWSRLPLMAAVLCVCSASALVAATVDIDSFDLPPGKSVTIEFEVTVDSPMPPGDTQVCNQGTMTATNPSAGVLTDDPDVGGATDPTCTTILLVADLSVNKTDGATTEVPGTPVTYTIVAANAGPATIADGVVSDTFAGILSGCTWTASVTAGTASGFDAVGSGNINDTGITMAMGGQITYVVTCNIAPGATGSLANTVTISSAATSDPAPANNSSTDTDTLVPSTDVAISKTDGASTEIPGTTVTYTIVASNSGPSTATGVTVADTFPGILSGCSTTSVAAGGATGNDVGPTAGNINDSGITLPPSATVTYTSTCTIAATATGSLANTATISSATTDPNSGNNSSTDTDTLNPEADLSIIKTDGVTSEVPGTPVTYTITVLNNGPSQATGVNVTDTFPGILSGCSTTSVAGGGATGNDAGPFAGNINDSGITLPVGILVTYTSTCNIDGGATGSLVNTASVSTSVTDPNSANDSSTDTDTLVPSVDVAISKTDGSTTEVPGTPVTYTIVVSNPTGPSTAAGVTVTDTFPGILSGCSTTSVAGGGAIGNDAGPTAGNISDSGITLPVGGTVTYTATCNIDPAATGSLANTASVSSSTTDSNAGNNSSTDTDTLVPSADVAITKSDGVSAVSPGASTTYTIVASNSGPSTATGVTVADTFPAFLTGCSTTSVAAGGATGNDVGPTAGNINDGGITLPPSSSVTYSATCNVDPGATGTIANTATISSATTDPNSGNNSSTDTNTVQPLDYGDAPTAAQSGFAGSYPVTQAQDGARHVTLGITLGAARDNEPNGLPTAAADGDDTTGAPDDEDGVSFPNDLVACGTMNVEVNASGAGLLDAWIDWNRDGDWADPLEQVATSLAVTSGTNNVSVSPPCALSPGTSFARFRLSSAGGLAVTGQAANGEVEDHQVTLFGLDFGDAPASFPVTLANNGARHQVKGSLFLGALTGDTEANGQPSPAATLDDTTTTDDEDGVAFTGLIVPGLTSTVQITASAAGIVNAWVDWNNNGTWEDPAERMFAALDQAVVVGVNNLPFNVPVSAPTNTTVYARFRVSTSGGLAPTGFVSGGEVEDHAVVIAPVADLSVNKTDGSTTEVPGTPVTYTIVVSNAGPNGVTGANFGDTFVGILSGCSWTSVAAGGASGNSSSSGGAITDALTLPSGSSVTYTVTCNISATATGTLVNTATIGVPSGVFDPNGGNNSSTDTDTLIVTADVAITKTDGATTEVPGTSVVYTIVASNTTGPSVATGVTVTDTFPAILSGCSTTSVAAGGATGNDAGPVAGNLNDSGITLPVGATVTYTATCNIDPAATGSLANTASVSSTATDPTPGNNTSTDTDTLTPEVDVAVSKTDGATTEVPGTTVTYTMVVSNSGPSVATGVTFTDTFAGILSGCSTTSVAAGGATGNDAGPVAGNLNDTGISLPVSSSVTYTATCTIAATATGSLVNTASATVGGGITDTNPVNNSATDTDTLQPQADLGITKTDGATSEVPGTGITYTLVATNSGPSVDPSVTVTDLFPAALTGCSTTSVAAGGATGNDAGPIAGNVIDTAISMPVGASVTYTVNCTILSSATGLLVNSASVKSSVIDGNAANDLATDTDTLTPATDLQIVKTADLTTVQGGEALTYTLTVTNHGPSDATSVVITDNLPAEVTLTSTTGCTEDPNGIPTCTLGTLAAGASVAVDVLVQVDPAPLPPGGFTNTATVAGNETDSVPGNNSSSVTVTTDIVPPVVDAVETAAGPIAGCGPNLRTTIDEIEVVFSEAMATVGGDPEDADYEGNYRLFGTGGDFDFDNTGCSPVAGDAAVTIDSALYSANTPSAPQATVTLGVNGGTNLADGLYRLIACSTLEDLAGNQLEEDFVVDFRVDDGNLLVNGHYDCDDEGTALDPWVLDPPAAPQITRDTLDSQSTAGLSGSLRISSPGTSASFGFEQCVNTGASLYNLNGLVRVNAGPTAILGLDVACEAFSSAGCTGTSLGLTSVGAPIVTTSGSWNLWELPDGLLLPTGTSSVRCGITMTNPLAAAYDAWFDQIRLLGNTVIFEDGFESGNTSAWSLTVP